mmetsp:Transcript_90406/g.254903  ORF Transcript_90406/g.254903 Transcript_90406/m.254903 type:complete len:202 (-) Transcript_90406:42-647(-)
MHLRPGLLQHRNPEATLPSSGEGGPTVAPRVARQAVCHGNGDPAAPSTQSADGDTSLHRLRRGGNQLIQQLPLRLCQGAEGGQEIAISKAALANIRRLPSALREDCQCATRGGRREDFVGGPPDERLPILGSRCRQRGPIVAKRRRTGWELCVLPLASGRYISQNVLQHLMGGRGPSLQQLLARPRLRGLRRGTPADEHRL